MKLIILLALISIGCSKQMDEPISNPPQKETCIKFYFISYKYRNADTTSLILPVDTIKNGDVNYYTACGHWADSMEIAAKDTSWLDVRNCGYYFNIEKRFYSIFN